MELLVIPFLLLAFVVSQIGGTVAALGCLAYGITAVQIPILVGHINALQYFLVAFLAGAVITRSTLDPILSRVGPALPLVPLALVGLNAFAPVELPLLFAEVFLCALLVGGIARARSALPLIELLSSRLRFLGSVSYSLYLVNVPVMWLTTAAFAGLDLRLTILTNGLLLGLVVLIVSLPIAAASKRLIEDAAIAFGARLIAKREDGIEHISATLYLFPRRWDPPLPLRHLMKLHADFAAEASCLLAKLDGANRFGSAVIPWQSGRRRSVEKDVSVRAALPRS